jgi:hypothetical protein
VSLPFSATGPVNLDRQIVPAQGDPEQELDPGHDPVAMDDAGTALDQKELEPADVVGRRGVGRSLIEPEMIRQGQVLVPSLNHGFGKERMPH